MDTNKHISTLDSIAGYATEDAIWQLLTDLCKAVKSGSQLLPYELTPERILIEGRHFIVSSDTPPVTRSGRNKFVAPELLDRKDKEKVAGNDEALVWTIGALLYYCSSGRYVFGGRGGSYQLRHPDATLPSLRREHSSLSSIVSKCMVYEPSERISLRELGDLKRENPHRVQKKITESDSMGSVDSDGYESCWPEDFVLLNRK